MIGALYKVEADIRDLNLAGDAKKQYRQRHAKPVFERFFVSG
jgi:hypothetical protein